jgi:hypothetical protein
MRRNRLIFGVLAVASVWWLRHGDRPTSPVYERSRLQAAVLSNGFAALVRARDVHDSRRVIEVDRDGKSKWLDKVPQVPGDVRLVGTRAGVMLGWREDHRLKLATLDVEGNPDEVSTWGKNVETLCDGAASNEHRFAVGWLDTDNRVSFVSGPLGGAIDSMTPTSASAKVTWCGIASAAQDVAIFQRDADHLTMSFCGAKTCSNAITVPIGVDDKILGYGCIADSCLVAARDRHLDTIKLHHVSITGREVVKTLYNATLGTLASIVAVGMHSFAVAYMTQDGYALVRRFTADSAMTDQWGDSRADEAPTIAWAADKLFIVAQSNYGSESTFAIDMPR